MKRPEGSYSSRDAPLGSPLSFHARPSLHARRLLNSAFDLAPRFVALSLAALLLSDCGGGGGGGHTSSTGLTTTPPTTTTPTTPTTNPTDPSPTVAPDPATTTTTSTPSALGYKQNPVTQEDIWSEKALAPINAFVPIIVNGITGQNQVVSMFDTGVYAAHRDLVGQILTTQGYSVENSAVQTITTDPDSETHGTAVASLIVGIRGNLGMEGIAPGAKLVPIQFSEDAQGNLKNIDDAHMPQAINYVRGLGNVHVMNNSWNIAASSTVGLSIAQYEAQAHATLVSAIPQTVAAWQNFVNAGNVVVWAAGNESAAEPDAMAGLPAEAPALQPGWVAVVSITSTGALASYSNQCGTTAAYCIAAVGDQVTVAVGPTVFASTYAIGSGTSFAAPSVTGAIALLMSAAPNITAQQALQILFQTAVKTGVYAQSAIYGQGVVDLNRAMQPVGKTVIAASGLSPFPADTTVIATSGAFGATLAGALSQHSIIIQDSYRRPYDMPLQGRVMPLTPAINAGYRLAQFGRSDIQIGRAHV